jgi:hypothetical protein
MVRIFLQVQCLKDKCRGILQVYNGLIQKFERSDFLPDVRDYIELDVELFVKPKNSANTIPTLDGRERNSSQ